MPEVGKNKLLWMIGEGDLFVRSFIYDWKLLKYKGMKKGDIRFHLGKWNLNSD